MSTYAVDNFDICVSIMPAQNVGISGLAFPTVLAEGNPDGHARESSVHVHLRHSNYEVRIRFR